MATNEGELMRTCGPLYASFALESVSSLTMVLFFSYVLLVLQSGGKLKTPGKAFARWLACSVYSYFSQFWEFASVWSAVRSMPLMARLRWCRKCNTFICSFTILVSLVSVTRILHVNNINGLRYLGYAITCPIMMVELLVLIGPVVPLYHITTVFTWTMTFLCLAFGYVASLQNGLVWQGDILNDFNLQDQTLKFWFTVASTGCFGILMVLLPYFALLYYCGKCRVGSDALPAEYTKLLLIVAITWVLFPVWWIFSYEGMNILTNTKLNAVGFAVLNMASKGLFTRQMLRIARHEKQRMEVAPEQTVDSVDLEDSSTIPSTTPSLNSMSTTLWLMGHEAVADESIFIKILKPFDECESKSNMKRGNGRRPSKDLTDIPGSFSLGHQKDERTNASSKCLEQKSGVLPVFSHKTAHGGSRHPWNSSLPSLAESMNSPSSAVGRPAVDSGSTPLHQSLEQISKATNQIPGILQQLEAFPGILQQLEAFQSRLAVLEQLPEKELVTKSNPFTPKSSAASTEDIILIESKDFAQVLDGVLDRVIDTVPTERSQDEDERPSFGQSKSERPSFTTNSEYESEPEGETLFIVPPPTGPELFESEIDDNQVLISTI